MLEGWCEEGLAGSKDATGEMVWHMTLYSETLAKGFQ